MLKQNAARVRACCIDAEMAFGFERERLRRTGCCVCVAACALRTTRPFEYDGSHNRKLCVRACVRDLVRVVDCVCTRECTRKLHTH